MRRASSMLWVAIKGCGRGLSDHGERSSRPPRAVTNPARQRLLTRPGPDRQLASFRVKPHSDCREVPAAINNHPDIGLFVRDAFLHRGIRIDARAAAGNCHDPVKNLQSRTLGNRPWRYFEHNDSRTFMQSGFRRNFIGYFRYFPVAVF